MPSKKLKVLIGCERSGVVRRAFEARGHYAMSCDLEPADDGAKGKRHYQGSVMDVLNYPWDIGIFHPPCTFICSSGLHWNKRGRVEADGRPRAEHTEEALQFVQALLDCGIPRIALENPVGCISTRIRKPDQIIQPYQFGDDASKSTCLWLVKLPKLVPTVYFKPRMVCVCGGVYEWERTLSDRLGCPHCGALPTQAKPRWANQTNSGQNALGPSDDRGDERSVTYTGIANAMAKQWGR